MHLNILIQRWERGDRAVYRARVYEVEAALREGPGLGEVIDLELEVGRHIAGLDGGEVRSDDGGGGVEVCKIDGPDSGAGAEIEDALGVAVDGREEEGAVEG
jgi:hypothetical protein